MATVYLADDLKHERKVALKVLKPELAAVVGAERFLAEIKTTANLQHPHILPLHDSGEADSFLYYVMPYIEGETLRERIDRERQLPVDEALGIATAVANALQTAHEQGVVHRDIKPGNILLSRGEPLVADFGIALAVSAGGGGRLTETGLSLGTPFYMSPEQATGDQAVGPASDTFALACVLYEMLVGEPPYPGNTAQAVLGKIIQGLPVSATAIRRSVPANVDAAISKALERLPADRFTGAQEFAKALVDPGFRHGEPREVIAATPQGPWKRLSLVLAGSTALFALAFGWSLLRPAPSQPVSRQFFSTEGWAGLDLQPRHMASAPDGSSMILPVGSSEGVQLALKMRGSTEITPIPGTEGGGDPVYSPDGQWIAYQVETDVCKRPLVGGSPLRLAQDADPRSSSLAWLDDGTLLYEQITADSGRPRRVVQIPEDGGDPVVVFWPEENPVSTVWTYGLPGARGALVAACRATGLCARDTDLYVVDLRDLSSELILQQVARAWYAPTGHLIYAGWDGAVFAVPFDLGALAVTGGATPLFDGVRVSNPGPHMQLAADGTLLYVEGSARGGPASQQLVVVDLEGNEEPLVLAPRSISSVSWSPDGQSVVYSSEDQIYTYNVALGTTPRQLTFAGINRRPVFSPDGTRVAFHSNREGTDGTDLFVKNLDDDLAPRSIITLEANQQLTPWPSDSLIVFERAANNNRDLWTVDLSDPDNPRAADFLSSEADLRYMVVSPDGTLAAYRSNESGRNEIYVRSFPEPGGLTIASEGGGSDAFWSPDGNTLYYARSPGVFTAARIERDPVPVVVSRDPLFTVTQRIIRPFQGSGLHPDGDRFILARDVGTTDAAGGAAVPQRLILIQNFFEELKERVPN